ncbi:fumarylacetoacetate hydrolase family protein [candidate division WOR-3 bacterium]|nr:fumarylacetoacetate hydrolase family protein [candidate division WOR-3 bacterium]
MILSCDGREIDLRPTKIIAVARNYKAHAEEMNAGVPAEPSFFLKPPSALLPHEGEVVLPAASARVEYEVELAVIMKTRVKSIMPEAVRNAVLGYTVMVDVTARDIQSAAKKNGMPWTIAKGFDTFAPLGPRIVTTDSLDPSNLDIWLKVNAGVRQCGNTNQMVFGVEELISYVSHIMTLEPMDVIATGTPSGVGPMQGGDIVEAGIENIGILRFRAVREQ